MRREFQSINYLLLVIPSNARDLGFCLDHVSYRLGQKPGSLALLGMTSYLIQQPSSFILLNVFSCSTTNSAPRRRSPSTTFSGAFARNCSFPSCFRLLPNSFSIFSNSFFSRPHSAATSILRS